MQPGRGEQWPGQAGILVGEGMQRRGLICDPAQLWHVRLAPSSPEQGRSPPCCTGLGSQVPLLTQLSRSGAHRRQVSDPSHKTVVQLMRSLFVSSSLLPGAFVGPLCAAEWLGWGRQCCDPGPGPLFPPRAPLLQFPLWWQLEASCPPWLAKQLPHFSLSTLCPK